MTAPSPAIGDWVTITVLSRPTLNSRLWEVIAEGEPGRVVVVTVDDEDDIVKISVRRDATEVVDVVPSTEPEVVPSTEPEPEPLRRVGVVEFVK